eukprot:scpid22487/ scgid11733/ 
MPCNAMLHDACDAMSCYLRMLYNAIPLPHAPHRLHYHRQCQQLSSLEMIILQHDCQFILTAHTRTHTMLVTMVARLQLLMYSCHRTQVQNSPAQCTGRHVNDSWHCWRHGASYTHTHRDSGAMYALLVVAYSCIPNHNSHSLL